MNQSREKIGWIVVALGLVIALLAWLAPFNPIGPSPLSSEETVVQQEVQSTTSNPSPSNETRTTTLPLRTEASPATIDKRTALKNYREIYEQSGWCELWDYLVEEGGVSGSCPSPRMEQGNTDPNIEIIDGFVAKEGGYISAFALQADTEIYVNYSMLHCVSFDPTNLSITYDLTSNRVTEIRPNGWVASDISIKGPFSLWLRCDGNWN